MLFLLDTMTRIIHLNGLPLWPASSCIYSSLFPLSLVWMTTTGSWLVMASSIVPSWKINFYNRGPKQLLQISIRIMWFSYLTRYITDKMYSLSTFLAPFYIYFSPQKRSCLYYMAFSCEHLLSFFCMSNAQKCAQRLLFLGPMPCWDNWLILLSS